jgi:hypothetical protein
VPAVARCFYFFIPRVFQYTQIGFFIKLVLKVVCEGVEWINLDRTKFRNLIVVKMK